MHWRHRAAWSLWCEWVAVRQLISVFDQDRISRAWARWAVLVMSPADRSLMNHAARVFTHRFLVRSWATWAEATQRQRRKLRRLRTAASEWMGSRRRAAWLSWREMAAERRVMRAAAQSFRTPNLHRALASWKAASSSRLNARRSLQRAAQRMISQSLATCWRTWVEMAVTQRQVVRSLQFSMRFFMNRMLALGFGSWRHALGIFQRRFAQRRQMTRAFRILSHRMQHLAFFVAEGFARNCIKEEGRELCVARVERGASKGCMDQLVRTCRTAPNVARIHPRPSCTELAHVGKSR